MSQPLRLQPSAAVKEKRLAALLEERGLSPDDPGLAAIVEDAQLLGSLELAGLRFTWDEVRSSRVAGEGPAEVLALRRARAAVPADAPFSLAAIRAWHEALAGPVGLRRGEREREGAPARAGRARREPPRHPRGVARGGGHARPRARSGGRRRPRAPRRDPAVRRRERPRLPPRRLAPDGARRDAAADPRGGGRAPACAPRSSRRSASRRSRSSRCSPRPPARPRRDESSPLAGRADAAASRACDATLRLPRRSRSSRSSARPPAAPST